MDEDMIELGQVAYEAYCKSLAEHQEHHCVLWHRFPPYMKMAWTKAAEAVVREVGIQDEN